MNNYRSQLSPYQPKMHPIEQMRAKTMDIQSPDNPISQEVQRLCETYNLTAAFSQDDVTLSTLKTPGLIAIKCVLSKDGKPVGVGHGSSAVSRLNRGIERTIFSCLNGALMSAVNSACKGLDVLRLEDSQGSSMPGKSYMANEGISSLASDKQKGFLLTLIRKNVTDEDERRRWESQMDELTKSAASDAIKAFSAR